MVTFLLLSSDISDADYHLVLQADGPLAWLRLQQVVLADKTAAIPQRGALRSSPLTPMLSFFPPISSCAGVMLAVILVKFGHFFIPTVIARIQ